MRKLIMLGLIVGFTASLVISTEADARRSSRRSSFRSFSSSSQTSTSKSIIPTSSVKKSKSKTVANDNPSSTTKSTSSTATPTSSTTPAAAPAPALSRGGFMSNMASSFMGTGFAMWLFGNNNSPATAAELAPAAPQEVQKEVEEQKTMLETKELPLDKPQTIEQIVEKTNAAK